jgi:hypothetical protein
MMLVIVVWIVLPGPALFAFLIYSAIHFSGDWDDAGVILRLSGGVATVGAPTLFQTENVAMIFAYLAPEPAANTAAILLAIAGAISLAVFAASMISSPKSRTNAALEQGMIWITA